MEKKRKIARLKTRVCIVCGKTYKSRRIDSIFCSNACTQKDKRRRDKIQITELKGAVNSFIDDYLKGYIERGEKIRFESIRNYLLFDPIGGSRKWQDLKPVKEIRYYQYRFIQSDKPKYYDIELA